MLTSVCGGFLAAAIFAIGILALTRASRAIGTSAVAIAMATGLVLNLGVLAVLRPAPPIGSGGWLLAAGALNVAAITLVMRAVRLGKVGIVAAIVSTEGATAALLAGATGESLSPLVWVSVGVIAAGLVLASWDRSPAMEVAPPRQGASIALALGAALAAGSSLFLIGRLSQSVPIAWAVLPPRLVGVLLLGLPLLVTRRFQWSRHAAVLAAVGGACEMLAFFAYGWAAKGSVAIAAILVALFAPMSAVGAYWLWRERLSASQIAGVAVLLLGVAFLTVAAA